MIRSVYVCPFSSSFFKTLFIARMKCERVCEHVIVLDVCYTIKRPTTMCLAKTTTKIPIMIEVTPNGSLKKARRLSLCLAEWIQNEALWSNRGWFSSRAYVAVMAYAKCHARAVPGKVILEDSKIQNEITKRSNSDLCRRRNHESFSVTRRQNKQMETPKNEIEREKEVY